MSERQSSKIERTCVTCGKTFLAPAAEVKRRGGKYCSRPCYHVAKQLSLEHLFCRAIIEEQPNGCLLWRGAIDRKGYGIIYATCRPPQRLFLAHRIAWELVHGAISSTDHVLHSCDTPACVNTDHLFIGSHLDNMADMSVKERQPNQKITSAIAVKIRERYRDGTSQQKLADEYGIVQTTVSSIIRRKTWKMAEGAVKRATGQ